MRKTIQTCLFFCFLFTAISATAQEYGVASYYSDAFHGRKTASGEPYDKNGLTAAHKDYPFGTYIRVTRIDTKQSVVVRVNDRGPFIKGRIVELSNKAASKIDLIKAGKANVKIEFADGPASRSSNETIEVSASSKNKVPDKFTARAVDKKIETKVSTKPKSKTPTQKAVSEAKTKPAKTETKAKVKPETVSQTPAKRNKATTIKANELYQVEVYKSEKAGYGVQVGVVSSYESAMKYITSLQAKWFDNILISMEKKPDNSEVFRIILGPFAERDEANSYKRHLKKKKKIDGFVVDLATLFAQ